MQVVKLMPFFLLLGRIHLKKIRHVPSALLRNITFLLNFLIEPEIRKYLLIQDNWKPLAICSLVDLEMWNI